MKHLKLVLFFFTLVNAAFAQVGSIHGTVLDSAGKPADFSNVVLLKTHFGAVVSASGHFNIKNIPVGKYAVLASKVGFHDDTSLVMINANENTEINFILKESTAQLSTITINGVARNSGMGHLAESYDGVIYSGKKNEVLILDSITANTAQNNPRQVLGRVPGANYSETEGAGFPSNGIGFRGLNPSQSVETNTRQNGYNVTADLYGYPESYYLPPLQAVSRIEVTRGASSLQFGPQFGGVINYIMKTGPKNKPLEFTSEQTAGSYGLFTSFNSLGGSYKKGNYYSYVQYQRSEGWRPNSDYSKISAFAKAEYQFSNRFKAGLEYSLLRNQIHMSGGLSDTQFVADARASYRSRNWLTSPWNILALTSEYKISENTTLTFKSALNISARKLVWRNEDGGPQTMDSIINNSYVPREVEDESFISSTSELRLLTHYKISGVSQTLAVGGRFFNGKMKRQGGGPGSTGTDFDLKLYGGEYEYDLDFTTTNAAAFVENTFHVGKKVSITPGFRFEYINSTAKGYITEEDTTLRVYVDRSKNRYIPLAGIGFQIETGKYTNIYANCSQAYKPTDYSNQTPIGVSSKIDPNLRDANGYNADLGWRGRVSNFFNFDLGVFYMAYNKRIGLVTLTDGNGDPFTYRTNVANSVHQGVESYVEINPIKMFTTYNKLGTISFFNSFAYVDARYTTGEFAGKLVEFAPTTINRFGATYSIKGFSTTFLISHTSAAYSDANNTVFSEDATVGKIPSYQIMDWSGAWKKDNYSVKFGVNNLADSKYFTKRTDEYPGPGIIPSIGRTFYVGFGAKF